MALKKNEIYSTLWASCDELRGGMDASQYKDYVLTMLFMKYVSDVYKDSSYGEIVVPDGGSFDDMIALKGNKNIGEELDKIIAKLAEANDLMGVIDVADFNDEEKLGKGKELTDRLTKLIGVFEGLDLSGNRADGDDLLGDAYEYLMRHFATESGKSKGQFYTPSEVSRILAQIIGVDDNTPQDATVYDPTCGSGSLLLKVSDEAPRGLSIFGQEIDFATTALSKMNMILHGATGSDIRRGNTLASPQFAEGNTLKTFDFVVANPPFSNKNWTSGLKPEADIFDRFTWGTPPEKNGDYAFLLHIIKSLKSTGVAAVILPHGVLFRGNAEASIRRNLIKQGYIKGIIGLPANLFYGTGIPACIIVIDKNTAASRARGESGLFMIDASRGFMKDGNKNRLRSQDIHKIVDVFNHQQPLDGYSRMVSLDEIIENDHNLNIPRYIDTSIDEDQHDLTAHLHGGIPITDIDALQNYWQVLPNLRASLFADMDNAHKGYKKCLVPASEVKATILSHPEFVAFAEQSLKPFNDWWQSIDLTSIQQDERPKAIIHRISEDLLARYADVPLLDKYDIYQILMDYWAETMQDDIYAITQEGWQVGAQIRTLVVDKGEKLKETPDITIKKTKYKAELISPALIINHFYSDEQSHIDALQAELDTASSAIADYIEEHGDEEGLLAEASNDKGTFNKSSVNARLKQTDDSEEIAALKQLLTYFDAEATAKKLLKEAQEALDEAVLKHYFILLPKPKPKPKPETEEEESKDVDCNQDAILKVKSLDDVMLYQDSILKARASDETAVNVYHTLSIEDIKTLLVSDKWHATLQARIEAEIERITAQLANRIKLLDERYAEPLPQIVDEVEALSQKVQAHLKAMGVA
ncbi:type I restriction-modification system subunit M [Psychrobacter sp. I-STPA10]|uniref:type I restriction-modification system subunit M n=1 Tax=Psychrobacter sp. I-STPA10 TaxID=2585769 RepID=UPI001E2D397C|nr:type I restriction-modification system subunit M [Psychrobacter sp. I-STPA10]